MDASELISARMEGESFDKILQRVCEKELDERMEFLTSMLDEVKKATSEFEHALKKEDYTSVRKVAQSFQEIFSMVEDSCEQSGSSTH